MSVLKYEGSEAHKLTNGKKRIKNFTVWGDGELEWKGSILPISKQLEDGLQPEHYRIGGKHCKNDRVLRKVLSDKGLYLSPFLGGLERACLL